MMLRIMSFICFFGRIQDTIHFFRDLLTFNSHTKYDKLRATISMKRLIIKGRLYCMFLFSEQIWEKMRRIRYVLEYYVLTLGSVNVTGPFSETKSSKFIPRCSVTPCSVKE